MEKKIYTQKEAEQASVSYFGGDELAARVWSTKYALKDSFGNLYELTPDDMHHRLAGEIARIENKYANPMSEAELFELLRDFKYIVPAGSPMTGIGNDFQVASLSNCFVIGQDGSADSYGAIIQIDEEQVQLMKRRGGVGHDLSHIRPHGSPVKNSALTSTGLVPFMERYSNSTREVAQDGRRGALMLSVSIKHPDSEAFIDAKMESGKVTGANVSVKVHDDFMEAAIAGKMYQQQYPIDAAEPTFSKEIDAQKLWKKIIHNAWKSAEPGVLFWDTITKESVPDCYADLGYKTVSTNPCGEIPLCPYDSCRLLAINLYSYALDWYAYTPPTGQDPYNASGGDIVYRSGGFDQPVSDCRVARRRWVGWSNTDAHNGFRVAIRSVQPAASAPVTDEGTLAVAAEVFTRGFFASAGYGSVDDAFDSRFATTGVSAGANYNPLKNALVIVLR